MLSYITIIIISLTFSAFFSGTEIAFVTSNKLRIELDRKRGLLPGKILSRFVNAPSSFIASMLVGNNISLVFYGIFMTKILEPYIAMTLSPAYSSKTSILIIQTIISTLIILLLGEFLPKVLFRINANKILNFFSAFILMIYILLYPVTLVIINVSNFILTKIFKVNISKQKQVFSPIDVDLYLEEFSNHSSHHSDIKNEVQIFQNARDLPHIKIRECMIPRPEIIAVEDNDDIAELKNKFIENGLSKVIVYNENIDNIIGYVHAFDMFKSPQTISSVLRPIMIVVPESMTADKLLEMFIKQNKSIAVVVDEFGGTSGMITIEDLIEEIFGEIEDEYDTDEMIEKKISDNEYIFSGRLEIDYINEKYNLNLPKADDYETLAGLIISFYESIPEKNNEIRVFPFLFKITEVSDTRIEQVNLKIID